jgi:hypothetical protein
LRNDTWSSLDDSTRQVFAILVKDARHADFFSN